MAFPASPSINDVYGQWTWNGTGWEQTDVVGGSGGVAWGELTIVDDLDDFTIQAPWSVVDYV